MRRALMLSISAAVMTWAGSVQSQLPPGKSSNRSFGCYSLRRRRETTMSTFWRAVMRHQASDRLPSLIRGLRLAGVKAILCGVFLVLASFAASAQSECPDSLEFYPPSHDQPDSEIVGTDCYIGHDEPIVSFYSTRPGSASNMTWEMVLPTEKTANFPN